MVTKTLTITESAYKKLVANKRDNESFSQVIERFFPKNNLSLLDFAASISKSQGETIKKSSSNFVKIQIENLMSEAKRIGADSSFIIDILRGERSAIDLLKRYNSTQIVTVDPCAFELFCCMDNQEHTLHVLQSMEVLPTSLFAMMHAGQLWHSLRLKGEEIGKVDCMISACLLAHDVTTIITRDAKHFKRIPGISVISY